MRLLHLFLDEPGPGILPAIAASAGPPAAELCYRALVRVLLRQLSGLQDCRVRICHTPEDAGEAVRFWILPEILAHPDIHLDPELLDFVPRGDGPLGSQLERHFDAARAEGYDRIAAIDTGCIDLSARWINAAFAQLNGPYHGAVGPTPDGRCHLLMLRPPFPPGWEGLSWEEEGVVPELLRTAAEAGQPLYQLPPLVDIRTEGDFNKALLGPLGAPLRKAMKALKEDGF